MQRKEIGGGNCSWGKQVFKGLRIHENSLNSMCYFKRHSRNIFKISVPDQVRTLSCNLKRSYKEAGPFQDFLSHVGTIISVFVLKMIQRNDSPAVGIQSQKTQAFCVADFATLSDKRKSRSKIFLLLKTDNNPCVSKI